MSLWIVLGLMTLVAGGAALWPLVFRPRVAVAEGENDIAVYRDQLEEIERDRAAGTIGAAEAEAARVEVARRLLAAARRAGSGPTPAAAWWRRRSIAIAGLLAVLAAAGGLYYELGSPNLPGQPLAQRIAEAHGGDQSIEALFLKVERHLAEHPDDGRGWEVIAPIYMQLGRYDDAAKARANAVRLLGATAQRVVDFGEAAVAAANGVVTAEAKAAFDEAIRLDPTDVAARYYEGLAAQQDGSRDHAEKIWRAMLADAPEGAQWAEFVRRALARLDQPPGAEAAAPASPHGTVGEGGQDRMIRGMVERLAQRLRQDGSDVEGWLQLARSYKVLGETERARAAVVDARRALAAEPDKLRRLDEGIEALARLDQPADAEVAAPAPSPHAAAPEGGQDQMIRGMVERLAQRLRTDGSDVEGWLRLVRSYKVLGETEQARAAIADARRVLAADPEKLRRLDEGIKTIDVDG
jgi:cytochrome c-type biogenesis protein CcmH